MMNRTAVLHTSVVTDCQNLAIDNEAGPNGDTALAETLTGLSEGGCVELPIVQGQAPGIRSDSSIFSLVSL